MFYYFGYGSNINLVSLKAKGVMPITSLRAILHGWRLRFNVQHWFQHEGGMANIEISTIAQDYVEGVLHACLDEHLDALDAVESYGLGYDRIEVEVETTKGIFKAQTYIGLPSFIDDNCKPTQRYMNIILKGAVLAGLSEPYIEMLRAIPLQPELEYPPFVVPEGSWQKFNKNSLALHPSFTALAGAVFDMSHARNKLQGIINLFGGKDMTLFFVKRHDTSTGNETMADIESGNISDGAKRYINAYLHEFSKEYKYVGSYK